MSRRAQLELAYKGVVEEITKTCQASGRAMPNLVAVSKYKPVEDIEVLYQLGHRHFGENYVQELQDKAQKLPRDIKWHFIGNLQSGKAKIARDIPNLAAVETLDSTSKATKLSNQRGQLPNATPLEVWIQVNTSGEEQKAGVPAALADVKALADHIVGECPHLRLEGLMTIGSLGESEKTEKGGVNRDFALLAELRDELDAVLGRAQPLGLSMGMSHDFITAINQGATNIRVGSNIFGGRLTKDEVKTATN